MRVSQLTVGKKKLKTLVFPLGAKNLIVVKGKRGYIACGYLDIKVADKFKDVAVIVKGVKNIKDVLRSKVYICSKEAKKLGIKKGQLIRDVIKIIA